MLSNLQLLWVNYNEDYLIIYYISDIKMLIIYYIIIILL